MQILRAIGQLWQRSIWGKLAIGIGGLVAFCMACSIGALLVPTPARSPSAGATAQSAAPAVADAPTAIPTVAPTEAPTATPAPTSTPAPTNTPAPTATPTEVPTPTATPEPVVLKGQGQSVTDPFTPPASISKIVFQHDGRRNFIVTLYKPDGSTDILVNAIGPYRGIRPLVSDGQPYLEIKADGAWQATVIPMGFNDSYADGFEGTGDNVSDLFTPTKTGPVPFTFTHTGERNFIVYLHCAGGDDIVQNEIGAVDGAAVVNFKRGPCLWEVTADGDWTIKPK